METAGFSYESDIAPLRGSNFGGVVSPAGLERERMLDRESAMRIAKIEASSRNQEIAFRQQQLELERAAEATRLEREALTVVPEVTKALTSVMNDPSLDDTTKTIKVAELKFRYAGPATVSRTIGSLFTTAEGTNEARKADRDRVNALINPLIQTGESETLKKVLEGKNIPLANDYIIAAEAVGASKKAEAEQKGAGAQRTELLRRETAQQTAQVGILNDYMSTLRSLAPQEADVGGEIGTLGGKAPTTGAIPQAQPFKFDTEDRIQIEEMMRNLNPMLENEDLSKYSDENLYRSAVRSTTSTLNKLSGFDPRFPSNRFSANPSQ
jgi:hypothetical protein